LDRIRHGACKADAERYTQERLMADQSADEWEIDQDGTGRPLVRHRHSNIAVAAYVTDDVDGVRYARCPDCNERYALDAED
jgi:hypothetical protein